MTQRLRLAVAVAVLVFAVSTHAIDVAACEDLRPNIVRLGIPRDRSNAVTTDLAVAALRSHYYDDCARPLDIQLAFGSDYQMLEWLQDDNIDAAVVTDFALWMLGARQVAALSAPDGTALPRVPRIAWRATKANGTWQRSELQEGEYTRFLDEVYAGRPTSTLALASHLSTTGFFEPVSRAARHFAAKLEREPEPSRDAKRDAVWRTFFAATRFTLDCDTPERCLDRIGGDRQPLAKNANVLFFPGEEVLERAALPPGGHPAREHLVLQPAVKKQFGRILDTGSRFTEVKQTKLDPALEAAFQHPLFRYIVEPEPLYDTRIYGFTPDESLRLLRQQQRRAGEDQLALVLPGGGVKAAYQTGIVGTLYNEGRLWNSTSEKNDGEALAVRTVIGTSGGALLGFFVSQLERDDPTDLVQLLWSRNQRTLDTHDVFGFTDLPQYVSIGVAFLVFSILLAFFTGLARSPFYQRAPTPNPSWRGRLLPIALLFVAAPLLVRRVIGGEAVEDVPVIEGMFYSMMALLVMFADHCMVDRGAGYYRPRPTRPHALVLLAGGIFMISLALFATRRDGLLDQPVAFGTSFSVLGLMFIGAPLLLLRLTHRGGALRQRLTEIVIALVTVTLLLWFRGAPQGRAAQIGAFAMLVILAIATYLHSRAQQPWRGMPLLLTTVTLCATAVLCWPRDYAHESFSFAFINAHSLDLSLAAFLTSIGLVFLLAGVVLFASHDTRYAFEDVEPFFLGLVLVLAHVGATLGTIVLVSWMTDGYVHSLEMTPSFWATLFAAATLFGVLIIKFAPRVQLAKKAMTFLTGEHRNGALLPRRYARMLAVTSMGVLWWNFVIAPAIYGNRQATTYIAETIRLFQQKRGSSFAPSARFIATANLLERDGTNYFLFRPADDKGDAASPQHNGAQWWIYPTSTDAASDSCARIIHAGAQCQDFVRDVVIASGSPFPIFAAHKVNVPAKGERWFVDGGYSNNIPVDAARNVGAKQVLIVHSASPLEGTQHDQKPTWIDWRPGRLVMNAGRLPGFLFERSQQIDRLSRQNLFVVALAPPLELARTWPNLAQFDRTTVVNMLTKSREHLDDRIGIVESWGQPRLEPVDAR